MNLALLKSERRRLGVTQATMAKNLGFKDRSSYCLIENGKTAVSIDTANIIIKSLNLSVQKACKIFFDMEVQETSTNNLNVTQPQISSVTKIS